MPTRWAACQACRHLRFFGRPLQPVFSPGHWCAPCVAAAPAAALLPHRVWRLARPCFAFASIFAVANEGAVVGRF